MNTMMMQSHEFLFRDLGILPASVFYQILDKIMQFIKSEKDCSESYSKQN